MNPLLEVRDLKTYFFMKEGTLKAVDGLNMHIYPKETVGLVGESGCGKSVAALSIMRLLPMPGRVVGGEILLDGEKVLEKSEDQMRELRGKGISMIFQDPMTSLNPVFEVGDQISEILRVHNLTGSHRRFVLKELLKVYSPFKGSLKDAEAWDRAVEMLDLVGIPESKIRMRDYPHQFSGGMRQRTMIAIALACQPKILIADEPTTALDVTIQAQIIDLMQDMQKRIGTSILLITHDLGIVGEMCDRVIVMYAGNPVESGDIREIYNNPMHPYTKGLLECIPKPEEDREWLMPIRGMVMSPVDPPEACNFQERCDLADERCRNAKPKPFQVSKSHTVWCHRFGGES